MSEVKHTEWFDCTPEQFFNLLVDYEKYPEFLDEVKECEVLSQQGNIKRVRYHISVIKTIEYINEHTESSPHGVSWRFVSGDLFKEMEGHWKLFPDQGQTKAEYFVKARFGLFVPQMITKTLLSVNLPAMMKSYHQRVEQLYGGRTQS